MKLNRTGSNWNELERNKINENWDIIEGSYNDVVGQITDEVVGHLIDSAKLIWKEPVETEADLPRDAEVGETRMVREVDPEGISYVYRFDGEKWEKIQEIDVTLVNEVDARLTAQLAETMNYMAEFAVSATQNGFMGNGTEDDTILLNDLIHFVSERGGGIVYLPSRNIPYLIHTQTSIKMADNIKLLLDVNTTIKATPTGNSAYSIIECRDISNFEVEGGRIIGERHEHIGESGQWGHGIKLMGASNYRIRNTEISECWGDGIYVGPSLEKPYSEDGLIENVKCDDNRRNAIAITSAKGLTINTTHLTRTNGHAPSAGIDIEPNSIDDYIEGIRINNLVTENNDSFGIVVAFANFYNSHKNVDVLILNHKDNGSYIPFSVAKSRGGFGGFVNNIEPEYKDSRNKAIYVSNYMSSGAKVSVKNPYISNPFSESGIQESARYGNAISITRDSSGYTDGKLGNVHIEGAIIIEDEIKSYAPFGIFDDMKDELGIEDISFINPVKLTDKRIVNRGGGFLNLSDAHKQLHTDLTQSGTTLVNNFNVVKHIDNRGADGARLVSLSSNLEIGTKLIITVKRAHELTVSPPQGEEMRPLRTRWVEFNSDRFGTSIEIEKITKNIWIVNNIVGTWNNLNESV